MTTYEFEIIDPESFDLAVTYYRGSFEADDDEDACAWLEDFLDEHATGRFSRVDEGDGYTLDTGDPLFAFAWREGSPTGEERLCVKYELTDDDFKDDEDDEEDE